MGECGDGVDCLFGVLHQFAKPENKHLSSVEALEVTGYLAGIESTAQDPRFQPRITGLDQVHFVLNILFE
ncbi:MAG: hypothetical protein BRD57_02805 [Proteobacteria bacterium SW_6_67_9]|nr:MAG: hypothetical protein BRD57_02805 [Proteobacteria bacterium SW_6_67_9]